MVRYTDGFLVLWYLVALILAWWFARFWISLLDGVRNDGEGGVSRTRNIVFVWVLLLALFMFWAPVSGLVRQHWTMFLSYVNAALLAAYFARTVATGELAGTRRLFIVLNILFFTHIGLLIVSLIAGRLEWSGFLYLPALVR